MAAKTSHDHIIDLTATVSRVEGKIDTFLAQMATQDNRTTDLEVRTRKIENKQWWLSGVSAVIGAFFGGAGTKIFHGG